MGNLIMRLGQTGCPQKRRCEKLFDTLFGHFGKTSNRSCSAHGGGMRHAFFAPFAPLERHEIQLMELDQRRNHSGGVSRQLDRAYVCSVLKTARDKVKAQ